MENFDTNRKIIDFNKNWKFNLNDFEDFKNYNFDDSNWDKINLPHDWSINNSFTNDVSSEIGHLKGGIAWYRKSFNLPKSLKGKRINIDFDGIYMDSYIYVNGKLVGNYPNGYLPFSFDITNYVVFDDEKENIISIKVSNITNKGEQSSRWYSGSGIYRDVYLTITEPIHITKYGVFINSNNIKNELNKEISINITTTIQNDTDIDANFVLKNTILDYKTKEPLISPFLSDCLNISKNDKLDINQKIQMQNAKLWDIENPNLYLMKTEILIENKVIDTYETRFGFCYSEFDKDNGFSLNGKYMKLKGVCMHHDQGALGACAYESAIKRQMLIMKEMGVNAIRVTHNPASPHLIRICDEIGLMVIEEAFDTWFDGKNKNDYGRFFEARCTYPNVLPETTWAKFDLQQMIKINRNSPSIIMWSLGNEIGETNCAKGYDTVLNLIKWAKEMDISRPVTMGEDKFRIYANATMDDWFVKVANELDVIGMNYAEDNYDYFKTIFPNKSIYGSETSSAVNSRGYYSEPWNTGKEAQEPALYQLSSFDNRAVPWGKTATASWIPDRDRKWICGQFIWTGFDYIGEPTPWNQSFNDAPKSSYFGIVDTAGFPKDDYFLYQSQWIDFDKKPILHIFPHWNWENEELRNKVIKDGKIPIRIYSNAPKVELFVNNISKGEKSFFKKSTLDGRNFYQQSENSDRLYLEWELEWEYIEGTHIKAIAKDEEGNIILEKSLKTAGKPYKLKTIADRKVINADGYDLAYITVFAEDENGNFVPNAMNNLNFSIVGDGEIVGVDNGDSASWEKYKDTNGIWKRSLFNGKAIIIVKSTENQGKFTLKAQGANLEDSFITIFTKNPKDTNNKILGYELFDIYTQVYKMPILPKFINGIFANGDEKEFSVKWDNIDEIKLQNSNKFLLNGILENGDKIFININVFSISGVLPLVIPFKKGQMPNIPETANVILENGKIIKQNIKNISTISNEQINNFEKFEILTELDNGEKFNSNFYMEKNLEKSNYSNLLYEIKINDTLLENFDENITEYFILTDFNSNTPKISAKAKENCHLFILNPLSNNSKAIINVVSEDGKINKIYTLFFIKKQPLLKTVSLSLNADLENIKEDYDIDLNIDAILEDDSTISTQFLNVNYIVLNKTGNALIKNHKLFTYDKGDIEIYAKVKYMDSEINTNKISLNIKPNNQEKYITSFDEIEIKTFVGNAPILPKTILAHYNIGFPRKLEVEWENINQNLYQNINDFKILGSIKNTELKPYLNIKVLDAICCENYSFAIPEGYNVELPSHTNVYLSDGTEEKCQVNWEKSFIQQNDIKIYKGKASYLNNNFDVFANIRISDFTQSPNYVIQRNGYDLPIGLASSTNIQDGFTAKNLNDGKGSEKIEDKLIWCASKKDFGENWISVTIANEGLNVEKIVNKIRFGLINQNLSAKGSIALPNEYFVEYYIGDLHYELDLNLNQNENIRNLGENHPLNNHNNWKEVTYINKPLIENNQDFRRTIEVDFEPIKTHLIRVRMLAKKEHNIGSDELQVYGKIAKTYTYFDVNAIYLDGINKISEFFNNQMSIKLKENQNLPEIKVEATNNAAVTIIPTLIQKNEITIKIVPENRAEIGIKYYKIKINK